MIERFFCWLRRRHGSEEDDQRHVERSRRELAVAEARLRRADAELRALGRRPLR